MHKRITFRNMEHAAAIENYANDRLKKVEKFLENENTPVYIDLVLEPSKVHAHHRVELRVKSPHYDLISHYEGPEFYKILDHVVDVMIHELTEEKRKLIDERNHHIKTGKLWELKASDLDDEDEYEDDEFEDDEFEDDEEYDDEDEDDDDDFDIEFELEDEDEEEEE